MKQAIINGFTNVLEGPEGSGIESLHIKAVQYQTGHVVLFSAWLPSKAELFKLQNGCPVILGVLGKAHPPVRLEVGEKRDLKPKLIVPAGSGTIIDPSGKIIKSNGK